MLDSAFAGMTISDRSFLPDGLFGGYNLIENFIQEN